MRPATHRTEPSASIRLREAVFGGALTLAMSLSLAVTVVHAAPDSHLDFTQLPASGILAIKDFAGRPDAEGVLRTWRIKLPSAITACYFSGTGAWPADSNRVLPWMVKDARFGDLIKPGYKPDRTIKQPSRQAIQAFVKLADGQTLVLSPIAGPQAMGWLEIESDGQLVLRLGTLGAAAVSGDLPVLAWARSPDLYAALHEAWSLALNAPAIKARTRWRMEKTYPEPFRYLGWCSWEQYRKRISESLLLSAVDGIEASRLPIRWVLVDDGHQTAQRVQLLSYVPDARKFPNGWAPLLARRSPDRIQWMGIWHAYNGLWGNIAESNHLGDLNKHLTSSTRGKKRGGLMPKDDPASAAAFYDALIGSVQRYGFDFVKIDNQSAALAQYEGRANAVAAVAARAQALEQIVHQNLKGMINCMAQNSVCVFNTRYSDVTRCSIDYKLGNNDRAKSHIFQSYQNTLWLGQTVWPDHDMFHSSDPDCGQLMAISKAMSGAPVYLSDDPTQFVAAYITPLCYASGELLRPLAPAVPLPDSAFADALNDEVAYRVVAPLPNGCAAVAAYALRQQAGKDSVVHGAISAADHAAASAMLQPYPGRWPAPAEGLVAYDWSTGKGVKLDRPLEFSLTGFADKLVLLCPIREGWAVVGRADKYLSPVAVKSLNPAPNELTVTLVESGPLVIWSAKGKPETAGQPFVDLGNGFWKTNLPVGQAAQALTIVRGP